jgi:uncharacterized membrane protein YeaQ/YmgE (transglycosylase-associated protein family)
MGRLVLRAGTVKQGAIMEITAAALIIWAVVGAIIGWLASQIMTQGSAGIQTDLIVGAAAGVAGGVLFTLLGFNLGGQTAALLGQIVNSALGAIIGTFVWRAFAPAIK